MCGREKYLNLADFRLSKGIGHQHGGELSPFGAELMPEA